MDFSIPYEHGQLQLLVRRFIDNELRPLEKEIIEQRDRQIPEEMWQGLVKKSRELGLFDAFVPVEYGGRGIRSWLAHILVYEEIGKFYKDFRRLFDCGYEIGSSVATKDQIERFYMPVWRGEKRLSFGLTEPDAGSDNLAMKTVAIKKNGNWVINGMKHFITFAKECDVFGIFAKTDIEKRRISMFLVDKNTPGLKIGRRQKTMGPFENLGEVYLDDVVVPQSNMVGGEGKGMRIAFTDMALYRLRMGALGLGAAEYALKAAIDYAKKRVTFGQPLATRQAIQAKIVDSWMEIENVRWLTYYAASKADQGASPEEITPLAAASKVMGTTMGCRVLDRAIQIHGAVGYASDLPLERMYRDLRACLILEGSNEILKHFVIARSLLQVE